MDVSYKTLQQEIQDLNDKSYEKRIQAARVLGKEIQDGRLTRNVLEQVNNHVHTTYSFSPYEPASAAFKAWEAGLGIVGAIDHDSVGAARELLEVTQLLGMASTVGFELRAGFKNTPFAETRLNNPDSPGIGYMCVHGVPYGKLDDCKIFLSSVCKARGLRNQQMVDKFNSLGLGITIDYEDDVLPLSRHEEAGSVTERHILYAIAGKIIEQNGKGKALVDYLEKSLGLVLSKKQEEYLLDVKNPHYEYDLLGILKTTLLSQFFVQPNENECPDVRDVLAFSNSIVAISAYAYLGDVGASPTGDKKAQSFEDAYLDEFIPYIAALGFKAVTYMPPRNTRAQMERIVKLCRENNLMQISGVDVNSSRQSFNCPELLDPVCSHLIESAWALVAHEKLSSVNPKLGLFSRSNPLRDLDLDSRIKKYANIGRRLDHFNVQESALELSKSICV